MLTISFYVMTQTKSYKSIRHLIHQKGLKENFDFQLLGLGKKSNLCEFYLLF